MKIQCPNCSQSYEVTSEHLGKVVACQSCGNNFVVAHPKTDTQKPSALSRKPIPSEVTVVPPKGWRGSPVVKTKLWEQVAFGAVLLALGCVCGGLVWGNVQKRRADAEIAAAEERVAVDLAAEKAARADAERRVSVAAADATRADAARTEAERRLAEVEGRVAAEKRVAEERAERERKAATERENRSVISGKVYDATGGAIYIGIGKGNPQNGDILWYDNLAYSEILRIENDGLYGDLVTSMQVVGNNNTGGAGGTKFKAVGTRAGYNAMVSTHVVANNYMEKGVIRVFFHSDADVAVGDRFPISKPVIFDGTDSRGTRIIRFLTKAEVNEAAKRFPERTESLKNIYGDLLIK